MKKKVIAATVCLSLLYASTAYAGAWKTGAGENASRWWYDNGDGSYACNGWQWLDGDGDGAAQCYYFDSEGWLLTNTTTPDGYLVNEDGAWVANGQVQTQAVSLPQSGTSAQDQSGSVSRNGRYVAYAIQQIRSSKIDSYNSDDTRVEYYLEEQADGTIKWNEIWWEKEEIEIPRGIEKEYERFFTKTGDNTYSCVEHRTTDYFYEMTLADDGTISISCTWNSLRGYNSETNSLHYEDVTEVLFFRKAE